MRHFVVVNVHLALELEVVRHFEQPEHTDLFVHLLRWTVGTWILLYIILEKPKHNCDEKKTKAIDFTGQVAYLQVS